jgi:adenine-specific DNA-methyltransferase
LVTHPQHLLLTGDNLEVLPALYGELQAAVDVAYLDPPYDHGDGGRRGSQRHFAYNDTRGESWGGWLAARLEAMKPLLSERAPVAVSIGYRRVHELAGILARVFPDHELVTITVDLRRSPTDRIGVKRTAEYVLIAVPPGARLGAAGFTKGDTTDGWSGFTLSGFDKNDYPNQVYPIYVHRDTGRIVRIGASAAQGSDMGAAPDEIGIMPLTRDGKKAVWRRSQESAQQLLAAGHIRADKPRMQNVQPFTIKYISAGVRRRIEAGSISTHGFDERGAIILDTAVSPEGAGVPTVWSGAGFETREGSKRLEELIGQGHGFAYPKPVRLISDIITVCTGGNPDAVVLDIFGGSGTTIDAAHQLNVQDGGSRRAILIQLDEGNVVDVLRRRAEAVLGGSEMFEVRELPHS